MSDAERHVAGFVVWAARQRGGAVAQALRGIRDVSCHHEPGVDKLAVVVEADSAGTVLDLMEGIGARDDVLNVQLVYQHAESEASLDAALVAGDLPAESTAGAQA